MCGRGAGEGASAAAGHEEETKQLMEQYSQVSPYPQHFATRKPSFRRTEAPLGRRSQHAAQQETALSEQHGSAKSQLQERLARRKAAMELKMAKAQQLAGAAG